jgi:hypothetical protein
MSGWRKQQIEDLKMEKVIKSGLVAVLISPNFGAGWSTWNQLKPELLFDPVIVGMVEDGTDSKTIEAYCEAKYPDGYFGGADDLEVKWIPVGTQFRIHEYDGSETLELKDVLPWIIA